MDMKEGWIDRLVGFGCRLLHLEKHQKILVQMAKFVITGVIATALDWLTFYLLVYKAQMDPLIAQIFAFLVATLFNYYTNTRWVFETTKKKTKTRLITEFFVLSAVGLGISEGMLAILINGLKMNDMLAKMITTAVTMVFNYVTRKLFLEDRKKAKEIGVVNKELP